MIIDICITKQALKNLHRAPKHIQEKFDAWTLAIQEIGLLETRKSAGWHDEPLLGNRKGQRSIRLSKKWRAIYVLYGDGLVKLINIVEVTPHDY